MDRTVRDGPADAPRTEVQASSWHPDAREPRRAPRRLPRRAAGARLRAGAAGGRGGARATGVPIPDIYLEHARPGAARGRPPLGDGRDQRRRGALRDRGRPVDPRRPRPAACARPPKDGRLAIVSRHARGAARARHAGGGRLPRGRRLGGAAARPRRARRATSRRSSSPSSRTSSRSRPRPRACSTASPRCSRALRRARPAAVHRRRRPVLDGGDEPGRARVRRRPGPIRAATRR